MNQYSGSKSILSVNMNNDNSNLTTILTSKPKKHSHHHRRSTAITGESLAYSRQSILNTVKHFVKCVDNMGETVLVPSKLRDMDVKDFGSGHRDLYKLFNVLNEVKTELLWPESATTTMSSPDVSLGYSSASACNSLISNSSASSSSNEDESMGSFDSRSTGSDYESGDLDSVSAESTSAESSVDEETSRLAATFRYHLQGIKAILNSLGDSADFLSDKYQEEVESTTTSS